MIIARNKEVFFIHEIETIGIGPNRNGACDLIYCRECIMNNYESCLFDDPNLIINRYYVGDISGKLKIP